MPTVKGTAGPAAPATATATATATALQHVADRVDAVGQEALRRGDPAARPSNFGGVRTISRNPTGVNTDQLLGSLNIFIRKLDNHPASKPIFLLSTDVKLSLNPILEGIQSLKIKLEHLKTQAVFENDRKQANYQQSLMDPALLKNDDSVIPSGLPVDAKSKLVTHAQLVLENLLEGSNGLEEVLKGLQKQKPRSPIGDHLSLKLKTQLKNLADYLSNLPEEEDTQGVLQTKLRNMQELQEFKNLDELD